MRCEDKGVSDIRITYIGSGSRGWARTFVMGLAIESSIGGTIRLYDIDAGAFMADEIIGGRLSQRPEAAGKWTYETYMSLEEVLTGVDFVAISILPGTFDEMTVDAHMPERLGIYQSVGDTAGPGGMIGALCTIPICVEFAKAIRDYAPRARVVNYINPVPLCVETLYHVLPQTKASGRCHEMFGIQKVLKEPLESTMGLKGINRKDIRVNVLGISYFTWFDCASYKGIDLFPVYGKCVDEHFKERYAERDTNWANACFACAHRAKFNLFKRCGLTAATGDRRLAKFMPGDEYLKDPGTVARWKFGLTSMD